MALPLAHGFALTRRKVAPAVATEIEPFEVTVLICVHGWVLMF